MVLSRGIYQKYCPKTGCFPDQMPTVNSEGFLANYYLKQRSISDDHDEAMEMDRTCPQDGSQHQSLRSPRHQQAREIEEDNDNQ